VDELLQHTRGDSSFLRESQISLDENWTELWALLEDREDEILRHRADLMIVTLFEDVAQLDSWFTEILRFAEEPVIQVGTSTIDTAKKRLDKYKVCVPNTLFLNLSFKLSIFSHLILSNQQEKSTTPFPSSWYRGRRKRA
jgi:hypothetical protein